MSYPAVCVINMEIQYIQYIQYSELNGAVTSRL